MDFNITQIDSRQTQEITLKIRITGNQAIFAKCDQLCETLMALIKQVLWLTDDRLEFVFSANVKTVAPTLTHKNVQLPHYNGNGNGVVKQPVVIS